MIMPGSGPRFTSYCEEVHKFWALLSLRRQAVSLHTSGWDEWSVEVKDVKQEPESPSSNQALGNSHSNLPQEHTRVPPEKARQGALANSSCFSHHYLPCQSPQCGRNPKPGFLMGILAFSPPNSNACLNARRVKTQKKIERDLAFFFKAALWNLGSNLEEKRWD